MELEGSYLAKEFNDEKFPTLYGGASHIDKDALKDIAGNIPSDYYDMEFTSKNTLASFDKANFDVLSENRLGAYFF